MARYSDSLPSQSFAAIALLLVIQSYVCQPFTNQSALGGGGRGEGHFIAYVYSTT